MRGNYLTLLLIAINAIAIATICTLNIDNFVLTTIGTPIHEVFTDSGTVMWIFGACLCQVMASITVSIQLAVEQFFKTTISPEDQFERALIAVLYTGPSVAIMIMINDDCIAIVFLAGHLMQAFAIFVLVIAFNQRLHPDHFPFWRFFVAEILVMVAAWSAIVGYGSKLLNIFNFCSVIFVFIGFSMFAFYGYLWFCKENISRKCWNSLIAMAGEQSDINGDDLSIHESYALLYTAAFWMMMVTATAVTFRYVADFTNFDAGAVLVFVFSFVLFGVLISIIPTQVAAMLLEHQRKRESRMKDQMHADIVKAKRGYMRYVSHEVRSPLGVVFTSLDLTIEDIDNGNFDLPKFKVEALRMKSSCESVLQILNDSMMTESVADGFFQIYTEKLRAVMSIFEILDPLGLLMKDKKCKLVVSCSVNDTICDKLFIFVDHHKIGQVLRNLVTNAVKYSPESATISVNIRYEPKERRPLGYSSGRIAPLTRDGADFERSKFNKDEELNGNLIIDVMDCGSGISEDKARKLFEETSQINTLGGDLQGGGGSGLKLWLSREIARLHNGSLEYRPRINGTGSIFTLSLPCSLSSAQDDCTGDSAEQVVKDTEPGVREEEVHPRPPVDVVTTKDSFEAGSAQRLFAIVPSAGGFGSFERLTRLSGEFTLADHSVDFSAMMGSHSWDREEGTESEVDARAGHVGGRCFPLPVIAETSSTSSRAGLHAVASQQESQRDVSSVQSDTRLNAAAVAAAAAVANGVLIAAQPEEAKSDMSRASVHSAAQPPPPPPPPLLRFLVVDDSELNRKIVIKIIERFFAASKQSDPTTPSYRISEDDDGAPAVQRMREALREDEHIDLVVMDNIMNGMNGPEAAQLMREAGYSGTIAGHTGNVSHKDVEDFISQGADLVLAKPLNKELLKKILDDLVNASASI